MGFPVVNLTRNGANVDQTQEWFLVDPKANKTADEYGSPYKWVNFFYWILPHWISYFKNLETYMVLCGSAFGFTMLESGERNTHRTPEH